MHCLEPRSANANKIALKKAAFRFFCYSPGNLFKRLKMKILELNKQMIPLKWLYRIR